MADRLTGMDVLVRTVRLGGISAAARALHMSPAMATKHLDSLEERLGTKLVHRTTRRVIATADGLEYVERAEHILQEVAEADAAASARSVEVEGVVRISAPATFGVMHLVPLLPAFRSRYPGVTIEFGFSDRYVDLLEEGWDVAIRIGQLAVSDLMARKLAPMRTSLSASPDYLARHGMPTTVDELSSHDCLVDTLGPQHGKVALALGGRGELRVPVSGPLRADNGEALVRAAVAGQGIVYGPRFIAAPALAAGELVEIVLDVPTMSLGWIQAISHPARRPTARTRVWIDFLAEVIPPLASDW